MSKATCPSCASTFRTRPEHSGRQVRCPQCRQPLQIPTDDDAADDSGDTSGGAVRWVILGGAVVISLAVGAAGGFIFGHQKGRADNVRDVADAKTTAESAIQAKKTLEAELTAAAADRKRDKEHLEAELGQLATMFESTRQKLNSVQADHRAAIKILTDQVEKNRREAEEKKRAAAEAEKKKIATIPLTEERRRKSQIDAEYVDKKLSSTNRVILKGMSMLMGFNALCEKDDVTRESITRVVGDDRDLVVTAARLLTDVGSYIPSSSKKGLTLQESWDHCMDALGVKK